MFNTLRRKSIERIALHPFVRHVVVLAGGTALGQLIIALSSPFLTRLYSPEQLGMLTIFVSLLSPALSLASFRYEVAIVLPKHDETAIHLLYLSLGLVAIFTALSTGITHYLGDQIALMLNVSQLSPFLWLLPVSILGGGTFQVLSYWGIRRRQFKAIGQARLSQSVMLVAIQLGMGLFSIGPLGLLAGDAISRTAGSLRLARDAYQRIHDLGSPHWRTIKATAYRYRRFPQFSVGPAVLNSVSLQLPSILLSLQFGATPVGLYAIGQRILGMPLGLVSSAVGQVFLGDAALAAHNEQESLRPRFIRSVKLLAAIGTSVVIPVAIVAPYVFGFLFGQDWQIAGQYLQLLAPMLIASFVAGPMGVILDVLERQDLHLLREIGRIAFLLLAWWIARAVSDGPLMMVASLSLAGAGGYILGLIFVWKAICDSIGKAHDRELDI